MTVTNNVKHYFTDKVKNNDVERLQQNPATIIRFNSRPELSSYAAAHMPRHWYLAMRMKSADDWSGAKELEYKLWIMTTSMASRERWRIPKGKEYLRRMAGLAIAELAQPARYRQAQSWKLKVAFMGCDNSNWYRTWRGRYEIVYTELDEWVNRGFRWMKVSPQRISKNKNI